MAMSGAGLQIAESAAQHPSAIDAPSATATDREAPRLPRQGPIQASIASVAHSATVPGSSTVPKNPPDLAPHQEKTIVRTSSGSSAAGWKRAGARAPASLPEARLRASGGARTGLKLASLRAEGDRPASTGTDRCV